MNISFYRKDSKLKGFCFKFAGISFAKVGSLASMNIGSKINGVKLGSNFSITAFGKTLRHTDGYGLG